MTQSIEVSIKKDVGRLIAQALPAKLTFDQACMRYGMFNELYIHGVMNEIVVSNLSIQDFWVRPSYAHPDLQDRYSAKKKRGRSRELDFFVTPSAGRHGRSLAIEVKWTSSGHCTWKNIVTDLYRLKLVAMAEPGTDCQFVLCGPRTEVVSLLEQIAIESQKRAIGRTYATPLVLNSTGSKSGQSYLAPVDENGRLLGADSVREKLPIGPNGRRRIPTGINFQLLGEATVGAKEWTAAVWRLI
ncbi:hypothetical protein LVJ59_15200 [Microbacterium sp. KKR3/1]|uniref:hypothetical protein n=1 Tax=Microbacterium sp. KKR3/1 TaxID=2904241 RepID=UPI001E356B44|nr:hypothetical protein [Microbacterium sp. KKR3/1]MCE0510395.1 hypothetical protein [Microbacterium sp. KKR3/1]